MKYIALAVLALSTYNIALAEVKVCNNVANGVFLANLTDCRLYLTCYNNVAYSGSCPTGLFFSANTQRCDTAAATQCVPQCTASLTSFAYDKTCTKYVMCYDGVPVVQECLDNLQYNSATDRCDYPQNVDCQANMCTGVNDPSNITYLSSEANCSIYYICYNGIAVQKVCSNGLYFNLDKQGCDYKQNVNCTIPARTRAVMPYSKVPPTRANIPCPIQGSHFYPHEKDTNSYYFCLNGRGVVLTCSPGLIYDKKMESCRDPSNVTH